jgi:vitamin B12 transporter
VKVKALPLPRNGKTCLGFGTVSPVDCRSRKYSRGRRKMKKQLVVLGMCLLLTGFSAEKVRAEKEKETRSYPLGTIIVTATKTETSVTEVGSSTTVITGEDIQKSQKRTVLEVLRDVPGVTVMQNSTFGGTTAVYLRGAKPGQTLVLIDGVEVNDPMSTDRSFDFAHLTTDNIERIEIVRGPQSALYGSDAMAGVINIITKKGEGKTKVVGYMEGGSYRTFREHLGLSGGADRFHYSVAATRLDSEGVNKCSAGDEKDGYGNTVFSGKLGYKPFEGGEIAWVIRYTDAWTAIDDGAYDDDPNSTAWWKDLATKLSFDQKINDRWSHTFSASYHWVKRDYRDEKDHLDKTEDQESWYRGDSRKIEWQHVVRFAPWSLFTGGLEYRQEIGSSYYRSNNYISRIEDKSAGNKSLYLQNQFKFRDSLFITPGLRFDDYDGFGLQTTYRLTGAYLLAKTGTRFKANWGTGFKAPSLYQLYSSYGNPDLKPEESQSYDLGLEQFLGGGKLFLDLIYFYNDFKNMIDWDTLTFKYKNIGRAMTRGWEFAAKFLPSKTLTVSAGFTRLETEDKDTGQELLRRPDLQANLSLEWKFLEKADVHLGLTYVGERRDVVYDASYNRVLITSDAYTTGRLAASYWVAPHFQVFFRVENLFDKTYQDIHGFTMPGRSYYAGLKGSF